MLTSQKKHRIMNKDPNIPGRHKQLYTINTDNLLDFERVKVALLSISGVEDVLYDDQHSPPEITLLTDGTTPDTKVQLIGTQLGFQLQPKHLRIS